MSRMEKEVFRAYMNMHLPQYLFAQLFVLLSHSK